MPRPTAAQLAYGSATVVFSTLAMLLLTRTTNGLAVAAIGVASMMLGLVVAMALPMGRAAQAARTKTARTARATRAAASGHTSGDLTTRLPAPRAEARVGEHSLHR